MILAVSLIPFLTLPLVNATTDNQQTIIADTRVNQSQLTDPLVFEDMAEAATATDKEYILIEHEDGSITLYAYDIDEEIGTDGLANDLTEISSYPNIEGALGHDNGISQVLDKVVSTWDLDEDDSDKESDESSDDSSGGSSSGGSSSDNSNDNNEVTNFSTETSNPSDSNSDFQHTMEIAEAAYQEEIQKSEGQQQQTCQENEVLNPDTRVCTAIEPLPPPPLQQNEPIQIPPLTAAAIAEGGGASAAATYSIPPFPGLEQETIITEEDQEQEEELEESDQDDE